MIQIITYSINRIQPNPFFCDFCDFCVTKDNCHITRFTDGGVTSYEFPGGYATPKPSYAVFNMDFHFYVKDHLGSNVMVLNNTGIEQQTRYYPFGGIVTHNSTNPDTNHNKYTGKEFDRMHGLDWYDYVARQYDPVYGRFTSIDPLCEKYPYLSPYAYCGNNPIRFIDPDGREPTDEEAARIAAHVYGDMKDNILIGGWRVSRRDFGITLSDRTGLKSAVYERVINGKVIEYVYATAGTEDYKDWIENIKQPLGLSNQYKNAALNSLIISNALGSVELNFVGHSLGGGQAALNSLLTSNKNLKGRKAYTFNASGVSGFTKVIEGGLEILFKSENDIEAFILRTDPLNIIQNNTGIMSDVNGNRHYLCPIDLQSVYNGHSMTNILKNFGVNPDKYRKR